MEEQKNQLALVNEEVSRVTKEISGIKTEITGAITDNNNSLRACLEAGEKLLAKADQEMNDETDDAIAKYIKKSRATVKAMSDRRKTVTQVFDLVKKGFTTMEGFLNPKDENGIIAKLQKKRDDYAAYKIEQQRKAEAERQRQARITAQKNEVVDDTNKVCSDILSLRQQSCVSELRDMFSKITLESKDEVKQKIEAYPDTIKIASFFKHSTPDDDTPFGLPPLNITVDNFLDKKYPDLTLDEIKVGRNEAYKACHKQFEEQFKQTIDQTRQELLDTFDSKVAELQEQKRLEEERLKKLEEEKKAAEAKAKAEEEARKKAEEAKRIADEKAKAIAEKAAAEAAAKAKAAAEEARKKAEEAAKVEEEKKKHDAEVKAAEEKAAKEQAEKLKAEADKRQQEQQLQQAQRQAKTLFDQASISAPVKAKITKHIEIDAPDAFIDIIQLWWTHEGSKMSVDELSKKLGFMVKACEKLCNKDDISIKNEHIHYIEDIVAK